MKKLLLSFLCILAFTASSFAEDITLNGDSAASKVARKSLMKYYDGATWVNSGVYYMAYNGGQFLPTDIKGAVILSGNLVSCPDGKISIIKVIETTVDAANLPLGIPGGLTKTVYDDTLFACESLEDFLGYVASGKYPVSNK